MKIPKDIYIYVYTFETNLPFTNIISIKKEKKEKSISREKQKKLAASFLRRYWKALLLFRTKI